jgi:hypothetical protein
MNEHIKELADRLWKIHPSEIDEMGLKTRTEFYEHELKKFAELIVKECIHIMREQSYNTSMLLSHPPKSSAVWDACNAIEKKFGVK